MNIQKKIEHIRDACRFDFIKLAFFKTSIDDLAFKFKPVYASGNISNRYMRIVLQKRIGLAGLVLKTGRPHFIVNADEDISPENVAQYPIIMAEKLKSLGALPIIYKSEVIGVVLAGFRKANKMTSEKIIHFNEEVANQFGSLFYKERERNGKTIDHSTTDNFDELLPKQR